MIKAASTTHDLFELITCSNPLKTQPTHANNVNVYDANNLIYNSKPCVQYTLSHKIVPAITQHFFYRNPPSYTLISQQIRESACILVKL